MKQAAVVLTIVLAASFISNAYAAHWPAPQSPVITGASGYAVIPHAAVPPSAAVSYRAIFDANRAADKPGQLVPALDNCGSELNALAVAGVPIKNAHFVVVFHGPAMSALLTDAAYRARFGTANPNLPVLAQLRKNGVELYVCGQNLVADDVDPATLTKDVQVASDALIVLMTYQGRGYSLLSF